MPVVVFWDAANIPENDFTTKLVEVSVSAPPLSDPVWVDLFTGNAYSIPNKRVKKVGKRTIYTVPAYDSPAFIADRSILSLDKSWFVRSQEANASKK